jgi:ATP-binding cassette, subfamily B (MDR/TAP), member 10
VKLGLANASFFSGVHLAANLALLGVLGYGGSLVMASEMTVGTLTSFLFYSLYVMFAGAQFANFYGDLMKAVGASVRVFELLDLKPSIQSGTKKIENLEGRISFSDVDFTYPQRKEVKILNKLNFEVPTGKVMAVVGPSGTGYEVLRVPLLDVQQKYDSSPSRAIL